MLTYTDLLQFDTFDERLKYLMLGDVKPAEYTFGVLRDLNQNFYNSRAWKDIRQHVIGRDLGYDLGVPGYDIFGRVIVHHMNPVKPKDLLHGEELALDPEFLITVSHDTHLGIHFGTDVQPVSIVERSPGDTKLW